MVRSMRLQTLGAVATVLALGSSCAQTTTSTAADGGGARDATADAVAPACGLAPLVDLDREGIATPDGVAAWVDFSRASDERLVPPIATCGGDVRLPVMVRWTAPRAGYLRVRVQRDRPEPRGAGALQRFMLRRVAGCAWDGTSVGCGLTAFDRDPVHVNDLFEFPVEAGPQWLVLAWTFDRSSQRGLQRWEVPALRVTMEVSDASRFGQPCVPGWTVGATSCPVGSLCDDTVTGGPRCVPWGTPGGLCNSELPPCQEGLRCLEYRCVPAVLPGGLCVPGECGHGFTCRMTNADGRAPGVCSPYGTESTSCRDASDPRGPCDAPWLCGNNPFDTVRACVLPTPLGDSCRNGQLCTDGGRCSTSGRCVPPGSEHTYCFQGIDTGCLPGLRCRRGTCVRLQSRGGDCTHAWCEPMLACVEGRCGDPLPGHCLGDTDDCPAGQACIGGTCRPAAGPGERTDGASCRAGLIEYGGRCVVNEPGPRCQGDDDCFHGTVCRDYFCVVEGFCPPLEWVASSPLPDGTVCGTNARCMATSEGIAVCRPVGRAGGLCRRNAGPPCDEGYRCVGGVCVAASSKSGGVCADHLACPPGTRCDLGCVPAAGVGQEGGRCRRGAEGRGECDGGLRCDPATLTCSR